MKFSREGQLQADIATAVASVQSMESVESYIDGAGADFFMSLASYRDSRRLKGFARAPYQPSVNEIMLQEPGELTHTLKALAQLSLWRYDPLYAHSTVFHERDHGRAAAHMGCSDVRTGISVMHDWRTGDYNLQPFTGYGGANRDMTKLELAGILAAPHNPSPGDESKLQYMGYQDSQEVAERIAMHNRKLLGRAIPLPQGYRTNGQPIEESDCHPWWLPSSVEYS